jgi:hypothetical protein
VTTALATDRCERCDAPSTAEKRWAKASSEASALRAERAKTATVLGDVIHEIATLRDSLARAADLRCEECESQCGAEEIAEANEALDRAGAPNGPEADWPLRKRIEEHERVWKLALATALQKNS